MPYNKNRKLGFKKLGKKFPRFPTCQSFRTGCLLSLNSFQVELMLTQFLLFRREYFESSRAKLKTNFSRSKSPTKHTPIVQILTTGESSLRAYEKQSNLYSSLRFHSGKIWLLGLCTRRLRVKTAKLVDAFTMKQMKE